MNTFEITIQRKTGEAWPVIAEQSRPGSFLPVRSEGVLTVDPARLLALLEPRAYGVHLGEALFHDGLRDAFTRALADSNNDLRVLLFVEADDLRTLRWERLCAPLTGAWDFLALDQQVLYSLYLPSVTDSRFPAIGRRDLRALVVAASPDGLDRYGLSHFDVPNAIACAVESLGEIPYDVLASGGGIDEHPTLKPVGPASLDAICERLARETYTLLHIVGHGSFNQRSGETSLFLADNAGELGRVTATEIIARLSDIGNASTLPHFTFLSTCESAAPEAEGALGGLGQRLVRELGMPAVIAMTEKVSVSTALALAKAFYRQLRQHGEVDRALVEASAGLIGAADATVPALYSRLGGRPLFSDLLAQDRPLTNAEIRFGLTELEALIPVRGPVLNAQFSALAATLRAALTTESASLSPTLRKERDALLKQLEAITNEALEISFKALALGQEPPIYDARCPYLGLAAFHAENSAFFFGREPLVAKLVNRLQEHNFLAVLGGSGSGKSSLVLAGLLPALQAQQPDLTVRYLTPTHDPVGQLTRALATESNGTHQLIIVDQFEELFTLCPNLTHRQQFLDRLLQPHHSPSPPATRHPQLATLILTMRADFWGECAAYPQLRDLMQAHQELVGPMTAQELRSSMEQQARVVGLRFEADLSNTILDDVAGEPGAMPLLQHALLELWKRRHGRWLRAAEYRALGGVQQAIARTADSIYLAQDEADRERMRAVFLRLTRIDDGSQSDEQQRDTRRRVQLAELAADPAEATAIHALVQRLADARLVVTTVREGEGKGRVEIEVTHEALIRHWPRLRTWLDEGRVALRLRQSIGSDAAQWEAGGRADDLLPRWNTRLEETQQLAQNPRFGLNQLERAYLDACSALRDREAAEKEAQRQRELEQARALAAEQQRRAEEQAAAAAHLRRRAVLLAVAGAVAVLLAVAAGWFGVQSNRNFLMAEANAAEANAQRSSAEERRQEAEAAKIEADAQRNLATQNEAEAKTQANLAFARQLAAQARQERLEGNLDLALLLSIEAARSAETLESLSVLHGEMATPRRTLLDIAAHDGPVTQAAWNRGQTRILTGAADGSVALWDAQSGQRLFELIGHTDRINAAEWDAAEARILTASSDGTARLWNAADGVQLALIHVDDYAAHDAAWSPDGSQIATAGDDGTVRVWDAQSGEELLSFEGHEDAVLAVQWNRAGDRLLSYSVDGAARIWDVETGEAAAALIGHTDLINSARWNADESRVLTASADHTARIWDAKSGEELQLFEGHRDWVYAAAWSPDEKRIATASYDYTARTWDVTTGETIATLEGHTSWVNFVLWNRAGDHVLTISDDATARIWDPTSGRQVMIFLGHAGAVTRARWSADESRLLTAGEDGRVRIWDADLSTNPVGELPLLIGHEGDINRAVWSPDEQRILTASDDRTARVWDAESGAELLVLEGHADWVNEAHWSADGRRILTASNDGTARVWDAESGAELLLLEHADYVSSARWSPDETRIVTASDDGTAVIWDAESGDELQVLDAQSGVLQAIWNHDGSRVLGGDADGAAHVWDAESGAEIVLLDGHSDVVNMVLWNRDESRIFTGSDDATVKMWDAASGKLLSTFDGHRTMVFSVRLNAAADRLLTASEDGTARVWDVATGQEVLLLRHNGPVEDAHWNAAEDHILTASDDGTVRLWDAASGAPLTIFAGHTDIVFRAQWNQAESRILTASADGTARQFYTHTADVIDAACTRALRNMTAVEWAAFMQERSYQPTCALDVP
ncbi:MAG: CHAT domain-containing protein [Caldilineaceae bacterium]